MATINLRRLLRSRAALAVFLILPLILLHLGMSGRPAMPPIPVSLKDITIANPWSRPQPESDQAQPEGVPAEQGSEDDDSTLYDSVNWEEDLSTTHKYLANGHVVPNPRAQHPIYDLIQRSKDQWAHKLNTQSKTLEESVKEYRRRYHRAPPKGYDKWWHWAQEKGIPLVDEYDQIHSDLEPYWAIRPSEFRANAEKASAKEGMYTITCKALPEGGTQCTEKTNGNGLDEGTLLVLTQRSEAQLALIKPLESLLEETRAVFFMHDGPWQFVGHDYKQLLEDTAESGDYATEEDIAALDDTQLGWASGCAPHKPLRDKFNPDKLINLEKLWQRNPHSFIHDHRASMDVCNNPNLVQLLGVLNSHGKGPHTTHIMYPTMAMSKTTLHNDILAVSAEAWTEDVGEDPAWEDKKENKLLWRGKTTGILYSNRFWWNVTQRVNLISHAARKEGTVPVLPVTSPGEPVGNAQVKEYAQLNQEMMDVAFVDEPIQCDEDVCDALRANYHFAERKDWTEANAYKYLLDVDGNGWSARFKRLMSTNSAVLKSTIFPEWYTDRIQPWVHYIPIQGDLTDLYDVMSFFRDGHDDLAKEIAMEGKKWSQTFWRQEDMMSYQFRLFLELARLEADDREAASYTYVEKPEGSDEQNQSPHAQPTLEEQSKPEESATKPKEDASKPEEPSATPDEPSTDKPVEDQPDGQ